MTQSRGLADLGGVDGPGALSVLCAVGGCSAICDGGRPGGHDLCGGPPTDVSWGGGGGERIQKKQEPLKSVRHTLLLAVETAV